MVERTDGPFDYYQDRYPGVNGDSIRADSYDPGLHASTIEALAGELEGDSRQVASQLSGDITVAVQANPDTVSVQARDLAAKGRYAVGLMGSFAGMVDLFDIMVNSLNHQYKSNLAMSMRWAGEAAATTKSTQDDDQVTEAKMGPPTKAYLQPEYARAVEQLDVNADLIATKFKQGPTVDNVRGLIRSGLVPLTAAALYPGLTVSDYDRAAYFRALAYLPSAPDPDQPVIPGEDDPLPEHHWWDSVADGFVDAGSWAYNHTIVPGVNGLADVGQAIIEHPEDLLSMLAGAGLMVLGGGGEAGGGLLDVTGVGAIVGVPINIASAAVIASGAALTGAGGADLANNALQNHNTVLNEADGAGPRPGDSLPDSSRPGSAGGDWEGRVANNGKGEVWQDPASANASGGSSSNANTFRSADPEPDYPDGYVRFYNEHGQPVGLDGKPGSNAQTHIPKNPDGSYPVPQGWNP